MVVMNEGGGAGLDVEASIGARVPVLLWIAVGLLVAGLVFAALGGLFCLAYPKHTVLVCVLVFGSAAMLEVAQLLTPDRHARFADAMQKLAGGACCSRGQCGRKPGRRLATS